MIYSVSDSDLERMSMFMAEKYLDYSAKQRWVDLHNKTARVFDFYLGHIRMVPASGWWY